MISDVKHNNQRYSLSRTETMCRSFGKWETVENRAEDKNTRHYGALKIQDRVDFRCRWVYLLKTQGIYPCLQLCVFVEHCEVYINSVKYCEVKYTDNWNQYMMCNKVSCVNISWMYAGRAHVQFRWMLISACSFVIAIRLCMERIELNNF